jgi:hypothetical protein
MLVIVALGPPPSRLDVDVYL